MLTRDDLEAGAAATIVITDQAGQDILRLDPRTRSSGKLVRMRARRVWLLPAFILGFGAAAAAQPPAGRGGPPVPPGPPPTHADLEYAPPEPASSNGHKLDLYIPPAATGRLPVVIWTGGSAWLADTGKRTATGLAAQLNPAGYAVAGVSIRSSSQIKFPGQLHDIKAAIRWLRANAVTYRFDPERIAIMGDSSGGWTTAMAALTGDAPELEGSVGTTGQSSKVQAAVAFYPPTNFLTMDAWALRRCAQPNCHDNELSPESRLVGCAIQTCADKVDAANPLRYVTAADPPMMILHGGSDPLVPHNQGEQLYMALNKACLDAVFISLPKAGHGPWNGFLTDDAIREAATMRATASAGCAVTNPAPFTPTWKTVIEFLDKHVKAPAGGR
jgi:acetyl esterase/lipase